MLMQRAIPADLIRLAGEYPVITIIGTRQSEKSTLTRLAFPDKPYASHEQLVLRDFALSAPVGFLNTHAREGAILDEIQRAPRLWATCSRLL
jgi:hypothetical protein